MLDVWYFLAYFVLPAAVSSGFAALICARAGVLGGIRTLRRHIFELEADVVSLEARLQKYQKRSAAEKSQESRNLTSSADRIIALGEARMGSPTPNFKTAADFR